MSTHGNDEGLTGKIAPPRARRERHETQVHGITRVDDYHWLRSRGADAVIAHLEAENAYARAVLEPLEPLAETLFAEIKTRRRETDHSTPVPYGQWSYYSRVVEGLEHPIYCRRPGRDVKSTNFDDEQVLLDVNALSAEGQPVFLGAFKVSIDHNLLAYSLEEQGDERFTLVFKDLVTGEMLPDRIENTADTVAWSTDNRTVFYLELDETRRPYRVRRHRLGTDPSHDPVLFEEPDERFFVHVASLRSRRYVAIAVESKTTSEVYLVDARDHSSDPVCVAPRREGIEYEVDHRGEWIYAITNENAVNFKLVRAPVERLPDGSAWETVLGHDPQTMLEGLDLFDRQLVLWVRRGGSTGVLVQDFERDDWHEVELPEAIYTVRSGPNVEFDSRRLRLYYSSLVTPDSAYDYDLDSRRLELLKRDEILGGYDPADYSVERLWAVAADGTRVPISLAWRSADGPAENRPCVLYGYGAYGISSDPRFSSSAISLLERGFVYAVAHVRGGSELGRAWYDSGKLEHKQNTFSDFVACAEELISRGITRADRLALWGGSAGGLLVGAVINQRPELFAAAVAQVPFVDVVNTMLDASLPLTVTEYEEWGNPNEQEAFERILTYSPYDNVRTQRYPHVFVTAGINDPRVQYWEPAKWVAKLREVIDDHTTVVLKTQMEAGHGGPSGRYQRMREYAELYAFLIHHLTH